jgi:diguanylate cyclase (GGDEF)-like protein/PAS domain S-box-containing protein
MSATDDGLVGGRFELVRPLKCGQGVETHLALDRSSGQRVVIKLVAAGDVTATVRLRLQHEAEVLDRLGGATPGVHLELGHHGSRLYLAQPFVPGVTLQERLAAGRLSTVEALRVAADVLSSLEAAHGLGVLHRDVKPANIILSDDNPEPRAVLIDFGYARSARLDASVRDVPVGTVLYLAPEAAGLLDGGVDERSDLYSVGVVLYEALAARPPFQGDDVGAVLRLHLSAEPPPLRTVGVAVPRVVEALVRRLLAKDPADRYQTAGAALADLEEVIGALGRGVAEPSVVVGLHDRRRSLTEPAFVGRAVELAALGERLAAAAGGRGGLFLLEAESGGGKTRLLDELAEQAPNAGALVLRGQGVDQAGQRPYQLLSGIAEGIVIAAATDPSLAAALRERVGERATAVVAALPELAAVLDADVTAEGPEAYGEVRTLDALAFLLEALGSADRMALLILDDCQWADRLTIKLLLQWQRAVQTARSHVLLVAAFRSEEVDRDHPLRSGGAPSLLLGPLAPAEVRLLGESMAGPIPDEASAIMARLSDGSPFMAAAVLRGLVESGALQPTATGWEVDPAALADVSTSRRAALFLIRRLELLSAPTLELLSIGAVLGKDFDLPLAAGLAAHKDEDEVQAALVEARSRRILWVDRESGRCSFLHDKLREALLERLGPDERAGLHRAAASRIESFSPDSVFEIAYHFHAAGDMQRALPYAVIAAERARAQHALDVSEAHYRMAAAGEADDPTRRRVAEGLGDVLTLQGSYDEAATWVQTAFALAEGALERAALEGKLGDIAFKRGNQREAREALERGLRLLGRWAPRGGAGFLLGALCEVFFQILHTLVPRLFLARRSPEGADEEFLAIRLYSRLAYVYWFHCGKVACAWAHLREMNLAERYPPGPALAQAYSEHAPVCTMAPWYRRGIAYAEKSLNIRRDLGDLWGQGQSLGFYGVLLYSASRYQECIARCREAIRLLERTGDRWEVNTATWHIAFSLYRLGDIGEAVDVSRRLHAAARDIGDRAATGISLSAWSRASGGQLPEDIVAAELAEHPDDGHTSSEVHLAEAVRLLACGQPDRAAAVLERATALIRDAGLRQEYVAPVPAWLATARRVQAEAVPPVDVVGRRRALRRADRAARRARRLSRHFANNAPHALREQAILDALRGRPRRADHRFTESLAEAERQGARYEAALTLQARGRIGGALGWPGAADDGRRGDEAVAAIEGTRDPNFGQSGGLTGLSLADRFATLLAVGRRIVAATSAEGVYAAARQGVMDLLRPEHCHIVRLDGDRSSSPSTESGERVDDLSRSLIERAVSAGGPVVSGDAVADAAESLVLSGVRSVLCAPIIGEGRAQACFYLTHAHVGGLFGDHDIQLAEFVATLAGAALEHVAGSEARFRSLAQHSSDVITIVRPDGVIGYQSSSVARVFGYGDEDLVGRPLTDWVHPDDAEAIIRFLVESTRGESGSVLVECRLRRQDGSWCACESTLNNLVHEPNVHGVVLTTRDVTERKALEDELRSRAWHDSLTGLANRALFSDRVEHALARSRRQGAPLAVLFLDLDEFKTVNDTLGHSGGDALLKEVAERLLHCVRPEDTVARFGGDEFAVLLEDSARTGAEEVTRRVMDELRRPSRTLGAGIAPRASIGVALVSDRAGATDFPADSEEILAKADAAMYRAKARGKGCYEIWESAVPTVIEL